MSVEILTWTAPDLPAQLPRWEAYLLRTLPLPLSRHPAWLRILQRGLGHEPICLEASVNGQTWGLLPLAYLRSLLFGRFLVSLPYVNYGGVQATDAASERALLDRAIALADDRKVRFLELRHERTAIDHPALTARQGHKVHMHLPLPDRSEALWSQLSAKVRNQVRKGQRGELAVAWGRHELLPEFYDVFSRNMRDLGTPAFGLDLFRAILDQFSDRAELCVVRSGKQAAAGALLLHGWGISEVPSASCLREYRPSNANMLMYWHLLERAVERGQKTFDFGRSSPDSSTYRFKEQWGAKPVPAHWQYYVRQGSMDDMRKEQPRYQRLIRIWQHLPLSLTRLLGPWIVRGIP
jgi:FemAB-related protein (PEP-CTERM system-associated)